MVSEAIRLKGYTSTNSRGIDPVKLIGEQRAVLKAPVNLGNNTTA
jgi:hypothetical protein